MTMLARQILPRSGDDRNKMQWFMCGRHADGPPYRVVIWYSHGDDGSAAMFGSQSLCRLHRSSGIQPPASW
jgi:hypothetical protein